MRIQELLDQLENSLDRLLERDLALALSQYRQVELIARRVENALKTGNYEKLQFMDSPSLCISNIIPNDPLVILFLPRDWPKIRGLGGSDRTYNRIYLKFGVEVQQVISYWDSEGKDIFIHELTHYFDMQAKKAGGNVKTLEWKGVPNDPSLPSISDKGSKGSPRTKAGYEPDEVNARVQQLLNPIQTANHKRAQQHKQSEWFTCYPSFESFYKDISQKAEFRDMNYYFDAADWEDLKILLQKYYNYISKKWSAYKPTGDIF